MEITLTGRTALVTGGGIGIGRAIALALARCGADVVTTFYSHDDESTANEIRAMGRRALHLRLDAADSAEVNRAFAQAAEFLGGHIDILVNNAGHMIGRSPIAEMSDEHWFKVINVNLSSCFFCCRAVLPYMNTGWGRIVNMSSLAARDGGGGGAAAYAASKAGVMTLTRGLAKEVAPRGITVNALAPGLIVGTPFHFHPPKRPAGDDLQDAAGSRRRAGRCRKRNIVSRLRSCLVPDRRDDRHQRRPLVCLTVERKEQYHAEP
jgi:3-oxoacyl-[acyl-carrier protein] reductase